GQSRQSRQAQQKCQQCFHGFPRPKSGKNKKEHQEDSVRLAMGWRTTEQSTCGLTQQSVVSNNNA
ncbi:hypothetical protein, partial [Desulfuromonas thiophila]|uniref:hypothetical protein n=1 Tax=Desulfuromonas thiophila TaxID=57664 RepID=UPI0024A9060D